MSFRQDGLAARILHGLNIRRSRDQSGLPPLPTLPKERPRPITPTTSCNSFHPEPSDAVRGSQFFQDFPLEIRRKILREAFGDGVIHMDLIYDYPSIKSLESNRQNHCNWNIASATGEHGVYEPQDSQLPKQWIWRGSTCHRNPPVPGRPGDQVQPSQDLCRFGQTPYESCKLWPGDYPRKCFVGAMGWLLSCRQAYAEGIDLLYSTNTFHTASNDMLVNIDHLLLPQRLCKIKSLELIWSLSSPDLPVDLAVPLSPAMPQLRALHDFLKRVPTIFPNLNSLYLSVQGYGIPSDRQIYHMTDSEEEDIIAMIEEAIMKPFDNMVLKLSPSVKDCSLALPSTLYAPRRLKAIEEGVTVEMACEGGKLERHWRPVTGITNTSHHLNGYWVRHGFRDMKLTHHYSEELRPYSPFFMENMILYDL